MEQSGASLSEQGGWVTLRLEGQAGMEAAQLLHQQLMGMSTGRNMAIDWEGAEHVHACVLQVLLSLRSFLEQQGLSMTVIRDNPRVREYLQLSGLGQYFPAPAAAPEASSKGNNHG